MTTAARASAGEGVAGGVGAAAGGSQSRAASSRPSAIETCVRRICDWIMFQRPVVTVPCSYKFSNVPHTLQKPTLVNIVATVNLKTDACQELNLKAIAMKVSES